MSCGPIASEIKLYSHELNKTNDSLSSKRQAIPRPSRTRRRSSSAQYPILVHCHLCWDWVWQRPQQFVSRLSRQHRVLFLEMGAPDPQLLTPLARFWTPPEYPNVTVLHLRFPAARWGDGEYVDAERRRLVQMYLEGPGAGQFERPVQWFYDPMAVTAFAGRMGESLIVYDCMDELSKFRGAPPELLEREAELLSRADVVFTGGRKLFESKRRFHENCHFYGCGVDGAHFGRARAAETQAAPEVAALPKPVLGYIGVVDERLDYELLAQLADAQPDWSIVMVGPVTKLDPRNLPRRANLHWLGQRAYADLPALAKGFDLCLMPFALNEATEYINPTKALEYMATGRPIISTAVPDVLSNFSAVVKIARSPAEFVTLCRSAVAQPDEGAAQRGLELVAENSWESIVSHLEQHVAEALRAKQGRTEAL